MTVAILAPCSRVPGMKTQSRKFVGNKKRDTCKFFFILFGNIEQF